MSENTLLPLYVQIKEDIKGRINAGVYEVGQPIPSEREMCIEYQVSRMTVRHAISELQTEGYIYKIHGKGSFVSNARLEQKLSKLTSFTEDMKRIGRVPGSRILAFKILSADATISEKLRLSINDPVLLLRRIRLANDQPMSIENTYLNAKLVTGIEMEDPVTFSLYEYLRNTLKLNLYRAVQSIQSTVIIGKNAQLLNVPDKMLGLLIERTTFLANDVPIEYVVSQYRGDIYRFVIEMFT